MSMLSSQQVGRAFVVTLSRPPVNAINAEWIDRFGVLLNELDGRHDISVLHIRSDQPVFSAGADLDIIRASFASAGGPDAMVATVRRLQELYGRIERLPQVTVAEIGGTAAGGGFELALACDLRVASFDAKFGLPEVRLGLLPGAGGTQRLARLCGQGVARRLILAAELVDGALGRALGMAQWAVPARELADFTARLVASIAALPKAALAASKRCLAEVGEPRVEGFDAELRETRHLLDDPETRALVTAFLDRRSPTRGRSSSGDKRRVAP